MLQAVNGQRTAGMPFKAAIDLIRKGGRPLELELVADAGANTGGPREDSRGVAVTIVSDGPLGLALESAGGSPIVASCAAGSEMAKQSEQLTQHKSFEGMKLVSVRAGSMPEQAASALPLSVVKNLLGAKRPLRLRFEKNVAAVAAPLALSSRVAATFSEPGPLGLGFHSASGGTKTVRGPTHTLPVTSLASPRSARARCPQVLREVKPNSQAERHPELSVGMVLVEIQGESVTMLSYNDVIAKLKTAPRPVELVLEGAPAPSEVTVTFTKPGSLGMKLEPATGKQDKPGVRIKSTTTGSQADGHPQLRRGLLIASMTDANGSTVRMHSLPYTKVLELIKGASRPVTFNFAQSASPRATGPEASPRAVLAAQKAEEAEMARSRDTQSSPSTPARDLRAMQLAEEKEVEGTKVVSVTFVEDGPLGMRFKADEQTDSMRLVGINEGTQAQNHPQLNPRGGLVVQTVAGKSVAGKGYKDTLDAIKRGARPLTITFAAEVSATFTEPGTLGLKFTPNKTTGRVEVLAINPGTQAEQHPQLRG